jgi:type IV pilus assembly protein PilA
MRAIATKMKGFTFMELLVTIIVLVVLGSFAVPAYFDYARRSYFSDMVAATEPFKTGVEACFHKLNTFKGCSGGTNGIPADIKKIKEGVATLTVINGVITATPVPAHSIEVTDTYILTPKVVKGVIAWDISGGGSKKGYM